MIRSYYDVITISMLSAIISVSPDIFHTPAGYSLTALWSRLDWLLALPVAAYHFLPLIPSTEVCQERVGSLLSELIYALVGKTLPMAAKCPLISQRETLAILLKRETDTKSACLKTWIRAHVRHPSLYGYPSASVSL